MGISKCYLPEVEELKKQHETLGQEAFVNLFKKYDVFLGPSESHEFLKEKMNLTNKSEKPCTTSQK